MRGRVHFGSVQAVDPAVHCHLTDRAIGVFLEIVQGLADHVTVAFFPGEITIQRFLYQLIARALRGRCQYSANEPEKKRAH